MSGYGGEAEIERFCDEVAARFYSTRSQLASVRAREADNLDDLKERIGEFAGARNLSRKMVAYNLLRTNLITARMYRSLSDEFDVERAQKPDRGAGSPDHYTVRRHRVGPGLVDLIRRMVAGGALSTTKAGRVLGVKPTAVDRLVDGGRAA